MGVVVAAIILMVAGFAAMFSMIVACWSKGGPFFSAQPFAIAAGYFLLLRVGFAWKVTRWFAVMTTVGGLAATAWLLWTPSSSPISASDWVQLAATCGAGALVSWSLFTREARGWFTEHNDAPVNRRLAWPLLALSGLIAAAYVGQTESWRSDLTRMFAVNTTFILKRASDGTRLTNFQVPPPPYLKSPWGQSLTPTVSYDVRYPGDTTQVQVHGLSSNPVPVFFQADGMTSINYTITPETPVEVEIRFETLDRGK